MGKKRGLAMRITKDGMAAITIAALFAGASILAAEIPAAEALKGKGVWLGKTGSASGICGLVMCSEYPGGDEAYQAGWASSYMNRGARAQEDHGGHERHGPGAVSHHNAVEEFPVLLDAFIHKFESGKISDYETLKGIEGVYRQYESAGVTNDIIRGVGERIGLHHAGRLGVAEAIESIHLTAEPQNVNPEYQSALDEVIHRFESGKISDVEAIEGIREVHEGFLRLYITSDLIESVGGKIALIDSDNLKAADAVEAVHLTAEPQNVDPEFIGAVEEYTYQFELGGISVDDALKGIAKAYDDMVRLTVTSELIEDVGVQLAVYERGIVPAEFTVEEIQEMIEEAERAAAAAATAAMHQDGGPAMKELPPNHIDMPKGSAVPGCEVGGWCYMPGNLTVHAGDTVTWVNSDTLPHTVTSGRAFADAVGADAPNGFDSNLISGGGKYEHTFAVAGFYDYYCQFHPWMQGTVTVE